MMVENCCYSNGLNKSDTGNRVGKERSERK